MRIKNVNKHIDSLRLPPNNPQPRTTQFEKRKKKKKTQGDGSCVHKLLNKQSQEGHNLFLRLHLRAHLNFPSGYGIRPSREMEV